VVFVFSCIVTFLGLVHGTFTLMQRSYRYIFEGGWQGLAKNDQDNVSLGATSGAASTAPPHASHLSSSEEAPGLHSSLDKGNATFTGALILFILAVELTIKWNKIEGVGDIGSTGQLLPLIIGIGGMGRVFTRFIQSILEEVAMRMQGRGTGGVFNGSIRSVRSRGSVGGHASIKSHVSGGAGGAGGGNGVPLQKIESNATAVPISDTPYLPFVHMNSGSHS